MKRFLLYAFRWQCSTPILAIVVWAIPAPFWGAIVANLIGAMIFYWVDKIIFCEKKLKEAD